MPDERIPAPDPDGERFRSALEDLEREGADLSEEAIAKLEKTGERLREEAPGIDEGLDRGLAELEERARKARGEHEARKLREARRAESEAESYRGLGVGLTIAYVIIGVPILGAGVGWLLDRAASSSQWTAIGTVGGAAVGLALALAILNRASRN